MKKKTKIIISVCVVFLLLIAAAPLGMAHMVYKDNFGKRFETPSWLMSSVDDFNGLHAQRYTFPSDKGQQLVGYQYDRDNSAAPKGVIVMAHGFGGGGHNTYRNVADYFTRNGYTVFAYDATGNDESGGEAVNGLPQGLIDLDYALRFVKSCKELDGLPIMLFGHSWGGYSVGSVLNIHPDMKAAVMVAGFDRSVDMIEEEGSKMMGKGMQVFLPYCSLLEKIEFGAYASYDCMSGFEKSDAGVMIIQSADDSVVSFENNYQRFYDKYHDDERFTFIRFDNRGHDHVYNSDGAREYIDVFNGQFAAYVESLDTDLTAEIKTAYIKENLEKEKMLELDKELMEKIIAFYDSYIQ